MDEPDNKWEQLYQGGFKPWDTGRPDSHLVRLLAEGGIRPCWALDVGCGTGTNAIWLAEHGFTVTGIDVSPTALALAKAKAGAERCDFVPADFFDLPAPADPCGFVFDLGCFHIFDEATERTRFARRVFECLAEGGVWLSVSGNSDGQHAGIPTRTAADIVLAAEPCFEIVSLSATRLDIPDDVDLQAMGLPSGVERRGWACVMRKRG